jgi:hypothetical protein
MTILCKDPYEAGMLKNEKDKELFYRAVHKLLDHKRHQGRTCGTQLVANIPMEDFHLVADKLLYIVMDNDPTYHSYHNMGPIQGALSIFARFNIREGVDYAFRPFDRTVGKYGFKVRMLGDVLPKFGAGARPALPRLKAILAKGDKGGTLARAVKTIEAATGGPPMISFEEAKDFWRRETKDLDVR